MLESKTTDQELLVNMKNLKTLVNVQLKQMANKQNGIDYFKFRKYLSRSETRLLFTKIYEVKAELRARGFNIPSEFPEKDGVSSVA